MIIRIEIQGEDPITREYHEPVCIRTIADEFQQKHPFRIVLARFDRHVRRLDEMISRSGTLELLDMRDANGEVGHEMPVHDINVNVTRTAFLNHLDCGLQVHEVRRKDGRSNSDWLKHGTPCNHRCPSF